MQAVAAEGVSVVRACALMGVARSTFYRITRGYRHYRPVTAPIAHADRFQPAALSETERGQVEMALLGEEHADLSVLQTYWQAFDHGLVLCSQRTFYRIAQRLNVVGDRRRRRTTGGQGRRHTPVVAATRPNQLWSWDFTELRGPGRQRYKLGLVIDVYSRYPIAWHIGHSEDRATTVAMFTTAFAEHGVPDCVHADNGAVMRSNALLDALETAGVSASFSRPRVSDDNPFSESLFKTVKYDLTCPEVFDDIDHARQWTADMLGRYAREHRHSGIGFHTPESVYTGQADELHAYRQRRLTAMYQANPHRYRRPPKPPDLPGPTGINTNTNLSQTG